MTTPDPEATSAGDDLPPVDDVVSTPEGEEPSPEESALAQPQYPT